MKTIMLSREEAKSILNHLLATNQAFCFYEGTIYSREDCYSVMVEVEVNQMEAEKKMTNKNCKHIWISEEIDYTHPNYKMMVCESCKAVLCSAKEWEEKKRKQVEGK